MTAIAEYGLIARPRVRNLISGVSPSTNPAVLTEPTLVVSPMAQNGKPTTGITLAFVNPPAGSLILETAGGPTGVIKAIVWTLEASSNVWTLSATMDCDRGTKYLLSDVLGGTPIFVEIDDVNMTTQGNILAHIAELGA